MQCMELLQHQLLGKYCSNINRVGGEKRSFLVEILNYLENKKVVDRRQIQRLCEL